MIDNIIIFVTRKFYHQSYFGTPKYDRYILVTKPVKNSSNLLLALSTKRSPKILLFENPYNIIQVKYNQESPTINDRLASDKPSVKNVRLKIHNNDGQLRVVSSRIQILRFEK